MKRRTLIHLCITLTLALTACVIFYWKFVRPLFTRFDHETPKELRDAGVRVGDRVLARAEFARVGMPGLLGRFAPGIGDTNDVAVGELDGQPGTDVVVAGGFGARVFDTAGASRSEMKFQFGTKEVSLGPLKSKALKLMLGDVSVKDLDGDGVCEYLTRGSIDGAALFSHGGALLWSYGAFDGERSSIDDLVAGDLDNDGTAELVASWDALEAFSLGGEKLWQRPWEGSIHSLDVADADGDGEAEIIVSHGQMAVMNPNGEKVRDVRLPFYLGRFSVLRGPRGDESLLAVEEGSVWTFDSKGERVQKFPAPLAEIKVEPRKVGFGGDEGGGFDFTIDKVDVYRAEGAWVKLDPARPEMLAVITSYVVLDRSVLYVYDASGTLLYEEVMPEQCRAVAALPAPEGRPQEFLVGCDTTIWRYAPRQK